MRALLVVAVLVLASLVPHTASATPPGTLQADPSNPLWAALRATGHSHAAWASLLTSDVDHNGRTDFLDLLVATAAATGGLATPVELLVRGTTAARSQLMSVPGAVDVPAAGGVFLTVPLARVASLQVPGVAQIVWEPRAYVASSSNPAGGSPATLSQIAIHQGGAAWSAKTPYTGTGITIGILDTGADGTHNALKATGKIAHFKDCIGSGTTSYDDHGHGTHVASIAAGDDGTNFRGLAYQATLTIVKILDSAGSGTLAGFQCGVNYITGGGTGGAATADVATMSAGLGVPPLGLTTLNGGELDLFGWDAVADGIPGHGIPFTVAAGNWAGTVVDFIGFDTTLHVGVNGVNQVSSPGFSSNVVAVGAVDELQSPATFSAIGPGKFASQKPDVAAMGVLTWGALKGTGNLYEQWDGTSMATPLAAAALALLKEKDGKLLHTAYENALRNGAVSACVVAASPGSCIVSEPRRPDFSDGYGVVKVTSSLGLIT
ncbi:MAG: S8 family peptidase [Thermoplasmatota archaeon]